MVEDKYAEIVSESVRRLIKESEENIILRDFEFPEGSSFGQIFDFDRLKDMAALGVAMTRIINSAGKN